MDVNGIQISSLINIIKRIRNLPTISNLLLQIFRAVEGQIRQSNKTYKMTQKIILSTQKTAKKTPFFQDDKPKKFTRKRSDRDRSFDSKRSKQDSVFSQYIRQPHSNTTIKINLVNLANDASQSFIDQYSSSTLQAHQAERKPRKTMIIRTNNNREPSRQQCTLSLRIKILETQLKAKEGECQRFRLQLDQQKQRRRRADFDRKASQKEASAYIKQNQQLLTEIKKLNKEKQILNKQIQFLEKINYDEKARNILSYREKHMQEQIQKLKEKLQNKRTPIEIEFYRQMESMKKLKEDAEEKFRSIQSLVDVQRRCIRKWKDLLHQEQIISKQRILHSQEYCELRDRFKKFIDQYKEVRLQNNNLRNLVESRQTELVLSDSQPQQY